MQKKNKKIFVLKPDEIEALANNNHSNPGHILGMHECVDGIYVNAYIPGACRMSVADTKTGRTYPMEGCHTEGFYTVHIDDMESFPYVFHVVMRDGSEEECMKDPYSYEGVADMDLLYRFVNNDRVQLKSLFGARKVCIDGTDGVAFVLNAPGAVSVSVTGDFNGWDGRRGIMNRIDYTDCYELFIPGSLVGCKYKFEILRADGSRDMFADPYADAYEPYPGDASQIADISYNFKDEKWLKMRAEGADNPAPVNIYEVYAGGFKTDDDGKPLKYPELGRELAAYVKDMGYNYVGFMPLAAYKDEASLGYDMYGAYAPDARYGSPADFMEMVDILHGKGIGVIIDMVPVRDIDCMLYWIETYHIDGIRLDDRELVEALKERTASLYPGVLSDIYFNVGDCSRLLSYMRTYPVYRGKLCDALKDMSGHDVFALSHDMVAGSQGFVDMMPGGYEDKFADLRALYAIAMTLPGAKLMFMGQEFGQPGGFGTSHKVEWSALEFDANRYIAAYTKALNKLYLKEPALFDNTDVSFAESTSDEISVYSRCSKMAGDEIYILYNSRYADVGYHLSVSKKGSYREIFSSDDIKYGGEGHNNKTVKKTDKDMQISLNLPALSVTVIKAGN